MQHAKEACGISHLQEVAKWGTWEQPWLLCLVAESHADWTACVHLLSVASRPPKL